MKSPAYTHQYEDKLLEFAYGELPKPEADAVEAHVLVCQRCSQALSEIQSVRNTMAMVPQHSAPEAGLESLLAYAEQAAQRATKTQRAPSTWKRFLAPLLSMMALVTVGVFTVKSKQQFDTSPESVAAEGKLDELTQKQELQKEAAPAPAAPAHVVAAKKPPEERPSPVLEKREASALGSLNGLGGSGTGTGGAPLSATRRTQPKTSVKSAKDDGARPAEPALRDDFGNAGAGWSRDEKKKVTAPSEPPAAYDQPQGEEAPVPSLAEAAPKAAKSEVDKAPSKESFSLRPMNAAGMRAEGSEEASLEKTDALAADREASYAERQRNEQRSQSLQSARLASSRGDLQTEIRLVKWVLENGATGYEKVEALQRLCNAYQALGDVQRADPYCDRLLTEFPNSVAARQLSESRAGQQRATPQPSSAPKAEPTKKSGY